MTRQSEGRLSCSGSGLPQQARFSCVSAGVLQRSANSTWKKYPYRTCCHPWIRISVFWGVAQHLSWEAESLQMCPFIFSFGTRGNKTQHRCGFLSKQVCSLRSLITEVSKAHVKKDTDTYARESQGATNSKTGSVLEGGRYSKSDFAGCLPQSTGSRCLPALRSATPSPWQHQHSREMH